MAVENVRLDAELQARLDELRESRARIVEAGYAERSRVERDLHDGAQQRLVALALELRVVQAKLADRPAAAAELLEAAADELAAAPRSCASCARPPPPCWPTGGWCRRRGLASGRRAGRGRGERAERAPGGVEAAAYFVVSEALTNVARHADAGQAVVRVDRRDGRLVVEVSDDGTAARHGGGHGPARVADRVGALDGGLEVEAPGRGTTIRASFPVVGR